MKEEIVKIVRRRLDECRARGNFSEARFGLDFGIGVEIEGDRVTVGFQARTVEGATFLKELQSAQFFQEVRRV